MLVQVACGAALLLQVCLASAAPPCFVAHTTGYLRQAGSARTADGTSIWTDEPIVAAHARIPLDTLLWVDGFRANPYRVADRGPGLGPADLDFPVDSLPKALETTGDSLACFGPLR